MANMERMRHRQTLIDAGKGGRESGAMTGAASVLPSASWMDTVSADRRLVCSSTMRCASGTEIILY